MRNIQVKPNKSKTLVPYGIPTQNHQQSSSPFQIHIGKRISFWMSLHVKTENL